ncbi:hypothetical protein FOXG_20909 [Fusarium oxysporum f. sp. lycopersici 4287]|uniref:Uncharacterized protein n=1 Tax=Fusarium oxysporum f. sp. lycopersici (strain 4287 / CBS 123668 / FGSC 9935 / NRRL 34936) TaxID=426428 RepID=A0A0J9VSM6_FUSO4|nr:hypothetical protein FOXG_20909 [Fusarium oxysporum f. sp. lycopersici 4287]EWZ78358.1 hypothetical protein FOWG_17372 [Fusarium oxysporum f. sp. lycopersici MN25]KNB13756.1 hypothetical protein FOXG_20909 [Fusarium oxysporum f. sp. lycopersici 4287]
MSYTTSTSLFALAIRHIHISQLYTKTGLPKLSPTFLPTSNQDSAFDPMGLRRLLYSKHSLVPVLIAEISPTAIQASSLACSQHVHLTNYTIKICNRYQPNPFRRCHSWPNL